jgi:hypothetical protein
VVGGPKEKDWVSRYLLLNVSNPFEMDGERVEWLVASPRYEGDTIDLLQNAGGTVGCARVRPGVSLLPNGSFEKEEVVYCIIGSMKPNVT